MSYEIRNPSLYISKDCLVTLLYLVFTCAGGLLIAPLLMLSKILSNRYLAISIGDEDLGFVTVKFVDLDSKRCSNC